MNNETIENLREALKFSPENEPLRLLLAESLMNLNRLDEAEKEFTYLMNFSNNYKVKLGLATTFFRKGNYSACNVVLEDIIDETTNIEILILYTKALLKENSIEKAIEIYQKVLDIDSDFIDEELDSQLRKKDISSEDLHLNEFDRRFLEKPSIKFSDVGGMEKVKQEIELKIIKPLLHPEIYKSYGKKVGGGILLYGPPGCGKTFIAKATAGEVNAKFISVGLHDILDMWIGNSEKNLHDIFELARRNTPCVLFIDEIDALGASRSDMRQSSGRHLINQFLQELDGVNNSNEGVLILGATNTPWHLDTAFRRPGRFDRIIFVQPPEMASREAILRLKLMNKPTTLIDYSLIARISENFSGADIDAIIDIAIELKLESSFRDGIVKAIDTKDLIEAVNKHSASTTEWFQTAKNYAMFANDSGLYDDILKYLKIHK